MGCSGSSWGVLIEKLDERMRECSRSGGDCNIKFAFPVKLDWGSPIQGFGLILSMGSAVKEASCLELPWELEMAI